MKTLLKYVGGWLSSVLVLVAGPDPIYRNPGTNPDPVVIDAFVFENTGVFNIGVPPDGFINFYLNPVVPFDTQNTRYFTNTGTMSAIPGFNLQFIDDLGVRRPAAQIYNGPGATISGGFANLSVDVSGFPDPGHPLYGGMISLEATNIISRGSISGFYAGDIQIRGTDVDLAGSKLGNGPLPFSTFTTWDFTPNDFSHVQQSTAAPFGPAFFYPETDVRDIWWRYGNAAVIPTGLATERPGPGGVTNLFVNTSRFGIYTRFQATPTPDDPAGPFTRLSLVNPDVFVWTNQPSATNKLIEIAFVDHFDTNVFIDVSWQAGPNPNLPSRAAYIRFTTIQPDLVSQGISSVANQFVIRDSFGPEPVTDLLANSLTLTTQCPTNLLAFRAFPPRFVAGAPIGPDTTNSSFSPSLFTTWYDDVFTNGMEMTNQVTTNLYVTYAGQLKPFPSDILNNNSSPGTFIQGGSILDRFGVTPVPGASLTNVSGRVAIDATTLNIRNTRIQGQGMVSIRTDNLKSSRGAVIDAPILNYDLGSTNGRLEIKDLAKGSITRFGGNFYIYSTTFTNSFDFTTTSGGTTNGTDIDLDGDGVSDGCDTDGDGAINDSAPCTVDAGTDTTTNYVAIYHVTVIQNSLNAGGRSFMNNLSLRAPVVDIQDEVYVDGTFSTTAEEMSISGTLNLYGITNLTAANVPNLRILKNTGTLSLPSFIGLGLPPSDRLESVENSGTIGATGINIRTQEFENSGTIMADGGDLVLSASDFVNNGGALNSTRNVVLNSSAANLAGLASTVGGAFTLNVSDTISDGGLDLPGLVQTTYGVNLPVKPEQGDLPGTAISITAPDYTEVQSFWAAEDRGPTRAGYTNNASLGALALDIGVAGVITFAPVGEKNAIYVEKLELSDVVLEDLENTLVLFEGMTLYYAATSDNVDPASLDGFVTAGGGTLRWVKEGGVDPTVQVSLGDGRTMRVPRSLRYSSTLDSDGDGIVNASDVSPFDLVVVSRVDLVDGPVPAFEVQWNAAAGQTYQVQATTDLKSGVWTLVKSIKNTASTSQRLTLQDPINSLTPLKAYRVVVQP